MKKRYIPTKFNPNADLNKFKDRVKVGDYTFDCDTCGCRAWFSQATIQSVYTGKGNTVVCPNCRDEVFWGMVPYLVLPEKPVPITRNAQPTVTTASTIDFTRMPPTVN